MVESEHPLRLILHDFLSLNLCKELEFIHKSCCAVGYRPNVFSTTLSHLIATNCGHLLIPFVSIRERLKDKVEEFFGCEYELFIEFTGLISWTKGASIGWHSDDNRSYLKQRDFAAVCYLNNHGKDFEGGVFHFQEGEPTSVVPVAGDLVIYTADSCNIHSVDEITEGERLTLTLWFTRDSSHDEDVKLISLLSQTLLSCSLDRPFPYLPLPASSNMYWFPQDQASHDHQEGFDIRWARIHVLHYTFNASDRKINNATSDLSFHLSELLMEPLRLGRENELLNKEFVNGLHALQVVQFYCWKATELPAVNIISKEFRKLTELSCSLEDFKNDRLKVIFLGDQQHVQSVFGSESSDEKMQSSFNWAYFASLVAAWEDYSLQLHKELVTSLPHWRTNQSIFTIVT
ncbi:hypothetical protein MKW98_005726 [Papaver atlanticum]|uniref:procollagen-proline 3-dioxygenase n=1 Tax=Papaver atlanticum TaxID=357466 RepID=A0AAD4X583_9MAGN|nr:hypothetical protein MKW98_005726 [Papaver atlanticum]